MLATSKLDGNELKAICIPCFPNVSFDAVPKVCKCRYLRIAAIGADRSEGRLSGFLTGLRIAQHLLK